MLTLNENETLRIDAGGNVSVSSPDQPVVDPPVVQARTYKAELVQGVLAAGTAGGLNNARLTVKRATFGMPSTLWAFPDNPATDLAYETVDTFRDGEVSAFGYNFTLLLRKCDKGAIYLYFSNGYWQLGLVKPDGLAKGNRPEQWGASNRAALYESTWENKSLPSFSLNNFQVTDKLTLGAQGVEIYIKFNDQELIRFQEAKHLYAGTGAVKTDQTYQLGINMFSVTIYPNKQIKSKPELIHVSDFGFKASPLKAKTTAGSPVIFTKDTPLLKAGDYVAAEAGRLKGQWPGAGGNWPDISFPNFDTAKANTDLPVNTYAFLENTGELVRKDKTTGVWGYWSHTNLRNYFRIVMPKGFYGRVVEVKQGDGGYYITFDTPVQITHDALSFDYDNSWVLNKLLCSGDYDYYLRLEKGVKRQTSPFTQTGFTIQFPQGKYMLADRVIGQRPGVRFAFDGACTLYALKGCPTASIKMQASPGTVCEGGLLTLDCNNYKDIHGMLWWSHHDESQNSIPTRTRDITATSGAIPRGGFMLEGGSTGSSITGLTVINPLSYAIACSFSGNSSLKNNKVIYRDGGGLLNYVGWVIQVQDSDNCTVEGNHIESPFMCSGYESFKSRGTVFRNNTGTNVFFHLNNSGNWLNENPSIRITNNAIPKGWWTDGTSFVEVFSVNVNAGSEYVAGGGRLVNWQITQDDSPVEGSGNMLNGLLINDQCPNVVVVGGTFTRRDMRPGESGGRMAVATALGTQFIDFTANGKCGEYPDENVTIYIPGGKGPVSGALMRNITADRVKASEGVTLENMHVNTLIKLK